MDESSPQSVSQRVCDSLRHLRQAPLGAHLTAKKTREEVSQTSFSRVILPKTQFGDPKTLGNPCRMVLRQREKFTRVNVSKAWVFEGCRRLSQTPSIWVRYPQGRFVFSRLKRPRISDFVNKINRVY